VKAVSSRNARERRVGVVTDVDGCILDHHYRLGPARATLVWLRRRGVPVILCTSKTRSELSALARELGFALPAIVESGTAILVPSGTLVPRAPAAGLWTPDGLLVPLAVPIAQVRAGLEEIARATGGRVRGFGAMTNAEIARLTGLEGGAVARARAREFDEPFLWTADPRPHRAAIRQILGRHRLAITRGARFHHLHGRTDKGRAVRVVRGWLAAAAGAPVALLGLGDGPHDFTLLSAVDYPVIVPRPDGSVEPSLARLRRARRAPAAGPKGWSAAVRQALALPGP
jgi:mannosyl-3-phosphoglycerate phosphatase family protein